MNRSRGTLVYRVLAVLVSGSLLCSSPVCAQEDGVAELQERIYQNEQFEQQRAQEQAERDRFWDAVGGLGTEPTQESQDDATCLWVVLAVVAIGFLLYKVVDDFAVVEARSQDLTKDDTASKRLASVPGVPTTDQQSAPTDMEAPGRSTQTGEREAAVVERDAMFDLAISIAKGILFASGAIILLGLVAGWALFRKAKRPGWAVLVPGYNLWVLFSIGGVEGWMALVPGLNLLAWALLVPFGLAKRFGRSVWFAWGLVFAGVLFYPLLAFGGARYQRARARLN